jgi:hypothetical protein
MKRDVKRFDRVENASLESNEAKMKQGEAA